MNEGAERFEDALSAYEAGGLDTAVSIGETLINADPSFGDAYNLCWLRIAIAGF